MTPFETPAHMTAPAHLINEHYQDRYFDVVSALDESQQMFFDNNRLPERLGAHASDHTPLRIGETGFGAGRNVISLMEYLDRFQTLPPRIAYHSVELHPLSVARITEILDGFRPRAAALVDKFLSAYATLDITQPGWQRTVFPHGNTEVDLQIFFGEALDMLTALDGPCEVWFLDGHGPAKNPAMWRPELLMAIGGKTIPGGSCATFTVAGRVRRGLAEAGFQVNKLPGFGGKHDVLQATRLEDG
jgi:tRNA U34 5-methylaminomethyl-2-thiouridine-forming methyltransferase MnmC